MKKDLGLDKKIYKKCNGAIVISGVARSGTTIMGKILHSFKNVEYAFEPPMLFSLFATILDLDENHWKLLYETFLYEEFLINALAGRYINCNRIDDSSIYKVKSEHIVNNRLNRSLRKIEAEQEGDKSQIAYKVPDILPFLPTLKRYYPGTRIVVMTRGAVEVFNSLLRKGWFKDSMLKGENVVWPNRFFNGMRVPYWVAPNDYDLWCNMDEINRIAYYYLRLNRSIKEIPDCIIIRYNELIEKPEDTIKMLSDRLNLAWGDMTEKLVKTVARIKRPTNYNILDPLKSEIKKEVNYYSKIS